MMKYINHKATRWIIAVLACVALTAGCARHKQPSNKLQRIFTKSCACQKNSVIGPDFLPHPCGSRA